MSIAFCKHCGSRVKNGTELYCRFCGGSLRTNGDISGDPETQKKDISTWISTTRQRIIESAKPKIKDYRLSAVKNLDKLIKDVSPRDGSAKDLKTRSRAALAKALADLKQSIDLKKDLGAEASSEIVEKQGYAQELSQELLDQLRNDKCVVCYSSLNRKESFEVICCPKCGRGGCLDHLEEYLTQKSGVCPICRKRSEIVHYFRLRLDPEAASET